MKKGSKHTEKAKRKCREATKKQWASGLMEGRDMFFKKGSDHPYFGKRRENAPHWKGGRIKTFQGYIYILKPNHPNSNKEGYIKEHRYIMSEYLKRPLKSWEEVHHKNGIRDDNRIENLELIFFKKHYGKVQCPFCQKEFLIK